MFIGDDRRQLVHGLVEAFDRVAAGAGPELVCLVAPIGWGKTRIVQEFYARLATERQAAGAYWPLSIADATEVVEPTKLRKRVYPGVFTAPGGVSPEWFWWGLSCEKKADGRPAQAIEESKAQLFVHAEAIERRLSGRQSLRAGLRGDQVQANLVALAGVLGVFVPPVGWVATAHDAVSQAWKTGQAAFEARRRRLRVEADRLIDAEAGDRSALVDELAESLAGLSGPPVPLPTVIVLDDAHTAAESALALVGRLLSDRTARVLVVATAWPDELAVQEQERQGFGGWMAAADDLAVQRVDLDRLSDHHLSALTLQVAPATSPGVVEGIVARSGGNPFVLELILSLGMVRRSIVDGAITLAPDEVLAVPSELRRLYLAKWQELPSPVRDVLAIASVQGAEFVAGCAKEGALAVGLTDAAGQLPQTIDPYAWVRDLDDDLRSFVEDSQFEVAVDEARTTFSAGEFDALRAALVAYVVAAREDDRWGDLSERARHRLLENHVALARDGLASDLAEAGLSALELACEHAEAHRYREAVPLGDIGIEWLSAANEDPSELVVLAAEVADWVGEGGRPGAAVDRLAALVAEASQAFGPDDLHTLVVRGRLATWLGEAGRPDEALGENQRLLEVYTRVFGSEDPATLVTRSNLAVSLGEVGRSGESLVELQTVLADLTRVLGAEHPSVYATRSNLASCLDDVGRSAESATEFERLLDDQMRVLGSDHPDTLLTRSQLVNRRMAAGPSAGAADSLDELLDDHLRMLGPDHPDTLRVRAKVASELFKAGQMSDAADRFADLHRDCVRIVGPDESDTLTIRGMLIHALRGAERFEEAITELKDLEADQSAVLGADHSDSLWIRVELAHLLIEAGHLAEALEVLPDLIADHERLLGSDHPETLGSRTGLAHVLARTGDLDEALSQYQAIASDHLRVLGRDHPNTLGTLAGFAQTAAAAGLVEEAAVIMEGVVQGRTRLLGLDHPDTIASRAALDALRRPR